MNMIIMITIMSKDLMIKFKSLLKYLKNLINLKKLVKMKNKKSKRKMLIKK